MFEYDVTVCRGRLMCCSGGFIKLSKQGFTYLRLCLDSPPRQLLVQSREAGWDQKIIEVSVSDTVRWCGGCSVLNISRFTCFATSLASRAAPIFPSRCVFLNSRIISWTFRSVIKRKMFGKKGTTHHVTLSNLMVLDRHFVALHPNLAVLAIMLSIGHPKFRHFYCLLCFVASLTFALF